MVSYPKRLFLVQKAVGNLFTQFLNLGVSGCFGMKSFVYIIPIICLSWIFVSAVDFSYPTVVDYAGTTVTPSFRHWSTTGT